MRVWLSVAELFSKVVSWPKLIIIYHEGPSLSVLEVPDNLCVQLLKAVIGTYSCLIVSSKCSGELLLLFSALYLGQPRHFLVDYMAVRWCPMDISIFKVFNCPGDILHGDGYRKILKSVRFRCYYGGP